MIVIVRTFLSVVCTPEWHPHFSTLCVLCTVVVRRDILARKGKIKYWFIHRDERVVDDDGDGRELMVAHWYPFVPNHR